MKLRYLVPLTAIALLAVDASAQSIPVPVQQMQPMQGQAMAPQYTPGPPVPLNDPNGVYCREYTQAVMIGGVRRTSYGTACQQPDGTWKIVSNDQQQQAAQPLQFVSPPQYVSAPQYVVPPPAYYQAYPYPYYAPYAYGGGLSVEIGGGHGGYYHDHYYRH